jgi:hypothetical protein
MVMPFDSFDFAQDRFAQGRLFRDDGDKLNRSQTRTPGFVDLDFEVLQAQGCNLTLEELKIQSRIEHRRDNHIASRA